jgi:hypothetical protein
VEKKRRKENNLCVSLFSQSVSAAVVSSSVRSLSARPLAHATTRLVPAEGAAQLTDKTMRATLHTNDMLRENDTNGDEQMTSSRTMTADRLMYAVCSNANQPATLKGTMVLGKVARKVRPVAAQAFFACALLTVARSVTTPV